MTGLNTNGNRFVAKKLHESIPLPLPTNRVDLSEGPMSVLVAAGPYSTSDNLTFEPLGDLVKIIKVCKLDSRTHHWPSMFVIFHATQLRTCSMFCFQKESPDVCILLGPILDIKNPQVENGQLEETFDERFQKLVTQISNLTDK